MKARLSPIQEYLSYALAAAHRKVNTNLNARLRKHGMQIEAWRVLETLETGERYTMGQLADIVLMNPSALTKLVDRMVSNGLVHRQVAQSDHRQINVLPTVLGKKRMLQIRQDVEAQDCEMFGMLGEKEAAQLVQLLGDIAQPRANS